MGDRRVMWNRWGTAVALVAILLLSAALPAEAQADEREERRAVPIDPSDVECGLRTSLPAPSAQARSIAADRVLPAGSVAFERSVDIVAEATSGDIEWGAVRTDAGVQIVGTIEDPGIHRASYGHATDCVADADIRVDLLPDGSATLSVRDRTDGTEVASFRIDAAWAVDAAGRPVPTWYEASGATLTQVIDTTGAQLPVVFDPSYYIFACQGHYSDGDARFYVNMSTADAARCSVVGMFTARNNYTPRWGYEANVYNDYGYVIVRQDGECSGPADDWGIDLPDTGWAWDFQVPCKAHDYCYDLRGAGFSGTVSDAACDELFFDLMEAHCNNRSFLLAADCRDIRDIAADAVELWFVITNPDPGIVEIQNLATLKCADVEGPSVADNAPYQQWSCLGLSNQRFRIHPAPGAPGYFQIRATHSDKCARATSTVYQYTCSDTLASQRIRIQGALNADQYSLRGGLSGYADCWMVPNSVADGVDLTEPTCNDYDYLYIWRILDA